MKKQQKEKPKYHEFQNIGFMIRLAWRVKEKKVLVLLLSAAVLKIFSNLLELYITPGILGIVESHGSVQKLLLAIGGFVTAWMVCEGLGKYVQQNKEFGRITVRCEIIGRIAKKTMETSYPNLGNERFQTLLEKSKEHVEGNSSAAEEIWETLEQLLVNLTCFVLYTVLLSDTDPRLLLLILSMTVLEYFVSKRLREYEYRHREEVAVFQRQKNYLMNCMLEPRGAKDIRIFGLRDWLEELYEKADRAYIAFHRSAENVYLLGNVLDLFLTFFRNGIVYACFIGMVLKNEISVSEFLLLFGAVSGFTQWATGILDGVRCLQKQSLGISTIRECLEFEEIFCFEGGQALSPEKEGNYEIRLENVSFCYPGAEKDTLKNINLTLRPGEKLAVVGQNGAGKTTLVKLICGFLDPTEGRVLLNGVDIREYNRIDYYQMFTAVFQSFSLLPGTIAENVAQKEKFEEERLKDCLEKAGLLEKIEQLPKKAETYLNREVYLDAIALSGGETQRLMLARALYKDAPFLILDEPTAALDPIAEEDIYRKYHEMTKGKSSVYISHRLASTRFCDRIILIDQAGICEEGTHEELIRLGGEYAKLYEVQSHYYREGAEKDET